MNYANLSAALEHYVALGYHYIANAPWYVGRAAYDATSPPGAVDVRIHNYRTDAIRPADRFLVASGEQSLLELWQNNGVVYNTGIICVTPCFRVEPEYNALHHPYFMKVELMRQVPFSLPGPTGRRERDAMIRDALSFFEKRVPVRVVSTGPESYDIVDKLHDIELGSYGIHQHHSFQWVYGTGCAEPRLSYVEGLVNAREWYDGNH